MKIFRWSNADKKPVSLALQGGGAHGAFTWGVLDYLLEDGRLEFEGLSGSSAGAMNALVLAHGLLDGGRDGAREALARFWTSVSTSVPFELATTAANGEDIKLTPAFKLMQHWSRYFSPYELNPFNHNPLHDIVCEQINFERLRRASPLKLFIAATHANSGKLRLFRNHELSAEALLASACLPLLHQTVEIDGEPYWDGGFSANPAVFPLFYECHAHDIVLVLLTPLDRKDTPRSTEEIHNRTQELAFSTGFLHEMRAFVRVQDFVKCLPFPQGQLERRIDNAKFHLIDAQDHLGELATETKLAAHLPFLETLRDLGREQARGWLKDNYGHVGRRTSANLAELFS